MADDAAGDVIRSRAPVDRLEAEGRTLLLFEKKVVELSELALLAYDASADGIGLEALADHLVAAFGAPPDEDASAAVARVVDELRDIGALAPPSDPDPDPVT